MQIKKKLTRKQFLAQDDEVMSFMKKTVLWIRKNASLIVFGVIGVGVVVAAVWGFRYKRETDFRNSARLLSEARLNFYAKVEGEAAADNAQSEKSFKSKQEKYTTAITALDQFLQLYPSQAGAEDALFLKAEAYYNMGEYDKAILTYKEYIEKYNSKGAYNVQALSSIGYSYEAKGNYQEAVKAFQKVADDYQDYLLRDSTFMEMGRCYEQLKDLDKAKDAYQKVVINFSDSPLLKEAQSKLDAMNQNPAAASGSNASEVPKAPDANTATEAEKTPETSGQVPGSVQAPETSGQAPAPGVQAPATTGQTPAPAGSESGTASEPSPVQGQGQGTPSEKK